jgi:hypothetical protein
MYNLAMKSDIRVGIIVLWFVGIVLPMWFVQATDVFFDLRDSLWSWAKSVDDTWKTEDLPKALLKGNLFDKSYAQAESDIVAPALSALDATNNYINEFCWGKLQAKHTTNVFSRTPFWEDMKVKLWSRWILDDVRWYDFAESCIEVYKCYFEESLLADGVDLATYKAYTDTTYQWCMNVVSRTYSMMLLYTHSQYTHRNTNFWDDMIANANPDELPFDILSAIENIADLLFYNNQQASVISYYWSNMWAFLRPSDPRETNPQPVQDPAELSRENRIPRTIWVTPQIPEWVTAQYVPPSEPVPWWTAWWHAWWVNPNAWWAWSTIQNQLCEEPVLDETPQPDLLEYARMEREHVYERNQQFDTDTALAVALWSKVMPEIEELFWDDSHYIDQSKTGLVQEMAYWILEELWDVSASWLDAFKEHVKWCVATFTQEHPDAREKILYKSITQPSLFTQCVFRWICEEIWDNSQLWMYRIKVCKVPSQRWYNVNADQSVRSVEEIIDELSNVCYGLRESWQLLKHNKTKDHWTDKLMNIRLSDIFSFWISVSFKWPKAWSKDHAAIKRMQIERNKFLTSYFLWFSDDLTADPVKNKYNLIHYPIVVNMIREEETVQDALIKANAFKWATQLHNNAQELKEFSQQQHYSEFDRILQEFVRQNTDFWIFTAEHTKSMKESWEATHTKFKNSR